jgi:hypothetical protein
MTVIGPLRQAGYRVRQFVNALGAYSRLLMPGERAEARAWLPEGARPLFDAMPRNDQRHSLNVLRSLRAAGYDDPALMQAALLHDAAKNAGGVTLFHRIAVVLLKIARPDWAARLTQTPAPARGNLSYSFWVLANHPQLGAEMAAAAGCDPLAVMLIRRHQKRGLPTSTDANTGDPTGRLLAALQAADDDN